MEEFLGVSVRDFVCLVVGDRKAFQEFSGPIEGEVGVIDCPDQPVETDDLADELEVWPVEHAMLEICGLAREGAYLPG